MLHRKIYDLFLSLSLRLSTSLLNLCTLNNQEPLLKLTVSTLDYSRDGLARVILSKILTAATDVSGTRTPTHSTSLNLERYKLDG